MATQFRAYLREATSDRPHVEVAVFAGPEGSGALCGELTMRREEADDFLAMFHVPTEVAERLRVFAKAIRELPEDQMQTGARILTSDGICKIADRLAPL